MIVPVKIRNVPNGATVAVFLTDGFKNRQRFSMADDCVHIITSYEYPNHPADCTCQECIDLFIGFTDPPAGGNVVAFDYNYEQDTPVCIRVRGPGMHAFESHATINASGLDVYVAPLRDPFHG